MGFSEVVNMLTFPANFVFPISHEDVRAKLVPRRDMFSALMLQNVSLPEVFLSCDTGLHFSMIHFEMSQFLFHFFFLSRQVIV